MPLGGRCGRPAWPVLCSLLACVHARAVCTWHPPSSPLGKAPAPLLARPCTPPPPPPPPSRNKSHPSVSDPPPPCWVTGRRRRRPCGLTTSKRCRTASATASALAEVGGLWGAGAPTGAGAPAPGAMPRAANPTARHHKHTAGGRARRLRHLQPPLVPLLLSLFLEDIRLSIQDYFFFCPLPSRQASV